MNDPKEMTLAEFRLADFEKGKNYVIEASAGTGKTYTIVETVKSLLQSGVPLDTMLVVTYTEKAAGELKDRIRTALSEMPAEIKNDAHNDVDNAAIGTIHSFCQNIINEFFISAGKPSCQKLIDESAIDEFLKRYLREGEIYREICVYKKFDSKGIEDSLKKKIIACIEKYYLKKDGTPDADVITFDTKSEEPNAVVKHIAKCGTIQGFPGLAERLKVLSNSKTPKFRELSSLLSTSKNLNYDGRRYPKPKNMSQENGDALEWIVSIKKEIEKIEKSFPVSFICRHIEEIYLAWQKEKENLCEQTYNDMIRNVREEVVGGGALPWKIKEKYTYAIIDEFQDTNQKQWDIFRTVFLSEGHHLIVVGDPKQSIYSFQGADVAVYEKAAKEIRERGGEWYSLKHNYRATEDMIRSMNAFFDKERNPTALPENLRFSYSEPGNRNFKVRYCGEETKAIWLTEEEVSEEEYADIVCRRIIDFCSLDGSGKTKLQIWDKDGIQRDVHFGDFAVLARTRSEMEPMRRAFEKYGIPYMQYKNTALFSGKECADWIAVLEAILVSDFTGDNRICFRKAMLTYFFGYSFDDVRSPDFDKDSGVETEIFASWRALAEKREWARLIERVIVDSRLAEKMQALGDAKAYGTLLQIGEYCIDYLTRTDNPKMLIRNLRKQATGTNDEDEEENAGCIAKATDMDSVRIMTIHASKGLEFPIVVSAGGFKRKINAQNAATYHLDGRLYLTFDKNPFSEKEEKEELQRLFYVAYTRAKYLLFLPIYNKTGIDSFVRESVRNYKNNRKKSKENALFEYHALPREKSDVPLDAWKDAVRQICARNLRETVEPTAFDEREEWLKKFSSSLYFHTSHKHAYSSLSHGGEKKQETEEDIDAQVPDTDIIENERLKHHSEDGDSDGGLSAYDRSAKAIACKYDADTPPEALSQNFIAGAALGNALHRVFEQIDYTAEVHDIDRLIRDCFAEEKIRCKEEWIADVKGMVHNVLNAVLPSVRGAQEGEDSFSLREITADNRKNEVEFNFNIQDTSLHHYMNGFVDLIFRRGTYYSVLDWKSDRLNEDTFTCYHSGAEIKKHVDELYSIQRVLYSYCLLRWLKQFYPEKTEQDIFTEHFGGIYYVFLRGCNAGTGNGVYAQTWESYHDLENEYQKIVERRVY